MIKELQELFSEATIMVDRLSMYNGGNNEAKAKRALRNIREYLDEFFDSNVVIPRGDNRHPYADVLHEWVEDTSLCLESKQSQSDKGFYKVYLFDGAEYRIKPSEPVWEWLHYNAKGDTFWFTIDEFMKDDGALPLFVATETKRERR